MRTIIALPFFTNFLHRHRKRPLVKNRNSTNPDYDFDPIGYEKEADTNISLVLGLDIDLALSSRKLRGPLYCYHAFRQRLKVTEGYCNVSLNQFKQKYTHYLDTLTSPRESLERLKCTKWLYSIGKCSDQTCLSLSRSACLSLSLCFRLFTSLLLSES